MIEIKHILCPVDFSECSRHALDYAVAVARWYESTIRVLYAPPIVQIVTMAPDLVGVPPVVPTQADRDQILAAMHRFAAPSSPDGVLMQFEIREDLTVPAILDAARQNADLIVMGTHGRSGFQHLVLGSTTEKVLRQAVCPVLSVPPRAEAASPAPPLFRNILCAVDFSQSSLRGLHYAMSLAQEADARLTVLHAIELPGELSAELGMADSELSILAGYKESVRQERAARLRELVPDVVRAYCTVTEVLVVGKPYREILRVAAEESNDLIVIGIHGRSAASLAFVGSTTNHIVREARCPVLTLRT